MTAPDAVRPVTVVNIVSPSYTGTTWLGMLLGTAPRVFNVGAPDRVWGLRSGGHESEPSCRVHGAECPFWRSFWSSYDSGRSFYLQLAASSGRDTIVINNPSGTHEAAELRHPDLRIVTLRVVRDGRAITASYVRHHGVDLIDAVRDYARGMYAAFPFDPDADDPLSLRYEDIVSNQDLALRRIGAAIGVDYADDAAAFWRSEQHVTSGNAGAIQMLRGLQGATPKGRSRPFYEQQAERVQSGLGAFVDERWKDELGSRERFVFDLWCGRSNAAWGYEPDRFSSDERERFLRDLAPELRPWRSRLDDLCRSARRAAVTAQDAFESLARRFGARRVTIGLLAAAGSLAIVLALLCGVLAGWWLRGSAG